MMEKRNDTRQAFIYPCPPPRIFVLIAITLLCLSLSAAPASAATITVSGACSLAEAIENATDDRQTNSDCAAGTGNDIIVLTGDITLTGDVTLAAGDSFSTTTSLTVNGGRNTLRGSGLVFYASGVASGTTPPTYSPITVTINNLTLTNNNDSSTKFGLIRIERRASLKVNNSTFTDIKADAAGAAIRMDSDADELHITNSIFSNIGSNITSGQGGTAILGEGNTVTISKSKFSKNASRGSGGALYFSHNATVNISSSEFSNNSAGGFGGAIFSSGSDVTLKISTSLFTNNSASQSGGAIRSDSSLNVYRSVFSKNQSVRWGGAISSSGSHTNVLENSTFYDNKSTDEEGGAVAGGGTGTTTTIRHVTFVNNEATDTGADSNGNSVFAFASAAFHMYNSIVKTNTSHNGDDCAGLDTNTNNIIQDGSCSTSTALSVDPQLGARRGTYFPISPGSPAI